MCLGNRGQRARGEGPGSDRHLASVNTARSSHASFTESTSRLILPSCWRRDYPFLVGAILSRLVCGVPSHQKLNHWRRMTCA